MNRHKFQQLMDEAKSEPEQDVIYARLYTSLKEKAEQKARKKAERLKEVEK